jgi:hypothetical protein
LAKEINAYKIEIDCECGKPNAIENMIGCEGIKGKKKLCNVWKHRSCAGNLKGKLPFSKQWIRCSLIYFCSNFI